MAELDMAALVAAATAAGEALAADPDNADLKNAKAAADKAVTDATAAASPPKQANSPKMVDLRVLVDHLGFKVDQVIQLPPGEVAAAEASGWADSNKAAVAFARSQAKGK